VGSYADEQESDYGVYSRREAQEAMDDLPEAAQTVVQELWYGESHQNGYDLQQHTELCEDAVADAITVLEEHGLVRSRPDMVADGRRVYRLNIEEDAR
jgi:hypothetical protein